MIPLLIAVLMLTVIRSGFANDDKYTEAMKKNITSLYAAKTLAEYREVVNSLTRVAAAEPARWETHYYIAFGHIMMMNHETSADQKDIQLDRALEAIAKAHAIRPNESEVVALEGFVHMMRVTIDPASRGAQYSGKAMETFGKAVSLNPDNPRALALMAQMQFGTARFFNSSTADACATVQQALLKFQARPAASPLAPQWGQDMAEQLKQQCN